jgi:glutamate racemase
LHNKLLLIKCKHYDLFREIIYDIIFPVRCKWLDLQHYVVDSITRIITNDKEVCSQPDLIKIRCLLTDFIGDMQRRKGTEDTTKI